MNDSNKQYQIKKKNNENLSRMPLKIISTPLSNMGLS